jgi:hypothetical protein
VTEPTSVARRSQRSVTRAEARRAPLERRPLGRCAEETAPDAAATRLRDDEDARPAHLDVVHIRELEIRDPNDRAAVGRGPGQQPRVRWRCRELPRIDIVGRDRVFGSTLLIDAAPDRDCAREHLGRWGRQG